MKKRVISLVAAFFAVLFVASSASLAEQTGVNASKETAWSADYNAALLRAKESGRRVLINFTGSDWCHWCIKMDEETLSQKAFKEYADKHLVLVIVDSPMREPLDEETATRNENLKRQYGVEGFPTFVVLNPDGKEADRRVGYVDGGPDNFIRFLKVTENTEKLPK
jgi:protein disulfide-isomerase